MSFAMNKASAKEAADRIAGANRKCQKGWRALFAEVVFCEVLRKQFTMLEGVECDELREQAKSKNAFVAFLQNENEEFVSYYVYREYTVLYEKMKERRPIEFMCLEADSDTGHDTMVKGILKALVNLGFNGVTETNKLLRTPEEEAEAEANAVAKREANAHQKRVKMEMASKQFAKITENEAPREEEEEAPREEEEEAPREEEEVPREEDEEPKKRGRPKNSEIDIIPHTNNDDIIAQLVEAGIAADEDTDDETDEEGVEETKESVHEPTKKKRGRPSKKKMLVSGDVDEAPPPLGPIHTDAQEEISMLRSRVKQLEEFILKMGKEVPEMAGIPLMDTNTAEDIVLSGGFDGLENDSALCEDEDASVEVEIFTHEGVSYYKDSDNVLYEFGCESDDAVTVGIWNEMTKSIDDVEDDE
jgi:hypothetical protein